MFKEGLRPEGKLKNVKQTRDVARNGRGFCTPRVFERPPGGSSD